MKPTTLFLDGDLAATLDGQLARAQKAVEDISEPEFRGSDPSDLANDIYSKYAVRPIDLTEGAVSVHAEDADIDRSRFANIDHGFPGAAPTLRGTRVTYSVPFTGDPTLFRLKPSSWSTSVPYAAVTDAELCYVYDVPSTEVPDTKANFERELAETKRWLDRSSKQVAKFNQDLASAIESAVNTRSARLAAASEGLRALGLPVRDANTAKVTAKHRRSGSPTTPTSEPDLFDVALSFAGEDRAYVQEVTNHLVNAGAKVFYDEFESVRLWGKDLIEHLQDIYQKRARFCVMFISEHYVKKPWPSHERKSAQARALIAKEEYLLPARFDDSAVPGMAPTVGYVDLRTLSPEQFADMILAKIGVAKPSA